jgi:biopolymer transport protein ExbB/TolQ
MTVSSGELHEPVGEQGRLAATRIADLSLYIVAVGLTLAAIAVLTAILPPNSKLALFLLDYGTISFFSTVYPFTIQNVLHVLTAIGVAEALVRMRHARVEERYRGMNLLPTDDKTVLQATDLGPIRRRVRELRVDDTSVLPTLIDVSVTQLATTKSVEQAVAVYASTVEMMSHRLDLAYQTLRYLVWLIPTIGFIGTVIGISISLEGLENPKKLNFAVITGGLAIAFYTTVLALLQSVVLVFLMNAAQKREELALNRSANYCLRNLINRYFSGT